MPTHKVEQYQKPAPYPLGGRGTEALERDWWTSDRVGGKLVLVPHPYSKQHRVETIHSRQAPDWSLLPKGSDVRSGLNPLGGWEHSGYSWASVQNAARARLVGKLREGKASLGVTFGSLHQSRQMITDRAQKLAAMTVRSHKLYRPPKNRVDYAKVLAGQVLEGEFGWVPLVQDIHAAARTACYFAPRKWVRSVQKERFTNVVFDPGTWWAFSKETIEDGWARGVYSCTANVVNPNLWLANRLGLINPATVIWDLVPWSFVVNMFANIGQIIESFTDTMGLELSDVNFTRKYEIQHTERIVGYGVDVAYTGFDITTQKWVYQHRQVLGNDLPRPSLEFRVPALNWELAVIAASLLVQKVHALDRVVRGVASAVPLIGRHPGSPR